MLCKTKIIWELAFVLKQTVGNLNKHKLDGLCLLSI